MKLMLSHARVAHWAAFVAVVALLSGAGCATAPKKPFTVQGKDPQKVAIVVPEAIKAKRVELPAGVYLPGLANNGFGFGKATYNMTYMHPQGIRLKGWFGSDVSVPGGIKIPYDTAEGTIEIYYLFNNGGHSEPLPEAAKYKLVERKSGAPDPNATDAVQGQVHDHMVESVVRSVPPPRVSF